MNTTRRLLKNFLSLTAAEFISRLLSMLLYVYIANLLGVTAFGELAFATAFTSFFNIFADFGLTMIGIREITREKEKMNEYGNNILLFQVLLVSALLIILVILILILPISWPLRILTFIFGLRMIPSAFDVSYIFQAFERMEYVLVTRLITQVFYLGLGLGLLLMNRNIVDIPIALFIGTAVGATIGFVLLRIKFEFKIHRAYFNMDVIQRFTRMSFSIFSAAILAGIYNNLDTIILQLYHNADQVGYYSAGYKVVNTIMVFTVFIASSFFPLLSSQFKQDVEQFYKSSLEFAKSIGLVTLPITVGGIIYAQQIILLIYRKGDFVNSVSPFKVLMLLVLLSGLINLVTSIIVAADFQKYSLHSVIVGVIVNVILNFIFIPQFGALGAAVSIALSQLANTVYLVLFHYVRLEHTWELIWAFLYKPGIASIAMGLVVFFIPNLFLGIVVGAAVYFLVLYLIKGFPGSGTPLIGKFLPAHS